MNVEGMERFEEMARRYLNGTKEEQKIILSFLSEDEQKTFFEGVGFYHLFTDEYFYKNVRSALATQFYNENHREQAAG